MDQPTLMSMLVAEAEAIPMDHPENAGCCNSAELGEVWGGAMLSRRMFCLMHSPRKFRSERKRSEVLLLTGIVCVWKCPRGEGDGEGQGEGGRIVRGKGIEGSPPFLIRIQDFNADCTASSAQQSRNSSPQTQCKSSQVKSSQTPTPTTHAPYEQSFSREAAHLRPPSESSIHAHVIRPLNPFSTCAQARASTTSLHCKNK